MVDSLQIKTSTTLLSMAVLRLTAGLASLASLAAAESALSAPKFPKEDLILCDCGIGDNRDHVGWSTSRQMNWYQDIAWPRQAYAYPEAPDMQVQVPFRDGIYPWVPGGATATMPNGDVWSAYIEDGTPDGFRAGTAVTTKEGGQVLNCWAYRGRPVSLAINKTVNHDSICWSAFVCNRDKNPPPRPKDMGSHTSSLTTVSAAPATSFFTQPPATPIPLPPTTPGEPAPTSVPSAGNLAVRSTVSPRFINWPDSWQAFINHFLWDKSTGRCVGSPIQLNGYRIDIECAGIKIDEDTHMTLLLLKAMRDVGLNSLWFNQNPVVPGNNASTVTTQSWVVMPETFTLEATDAAAGTVIGRLSYKTHYDGFLSGPCSTCETARFNSPFFNSIIAAVQGSYPYYYNFTVEAQCDPWMACY
ncbi:hypothetical protein XA68_11476 [Ophiocordyceps unilateralis]|uniref:Uncharacterized protein n=1 Tax=Ophiocordyceps unilateralis TaxID=268505 RepID=A0A2A9PFI1_OPHUN|nr:hypothetical protein XA68_11476 [Ophiocordyceps unilateralis]